MKMNIKNYLFVLLIASISTITSYIVITPSVSKAEKEPCVRCSEVGCLGGTELCAQFVCRGTLVQCFTRGGFNS
ncbi:MAG: hypothetical protein HZC46_00185 [Ignavibacterium album]|jgi:hypothetical protein|uniref:hypothetical protein n=1 Tax=Ignavibacterium album TaxID=591197 RepID=UPI0026EC6A1B|nr:hypothetical protein [Ignavibacterium album]MBI5660545.1 hypothetical protein [Ignavibacterium album]